MFSSVFARLHETGLQMSRWRCPMDGQSGASGAELEVGGGRAE